MHLALPPPSPSTNDTPSLGYPNSDWYAPLALPPPSLAPYWRSSRRKTPTWANWGSSCCHCRTKKAQGEKLSPGQLVYILSKHKWYSLTRLPKQCHVCFPGIVIAITIFVPKKNRLRNSCLGRLGYISPIGLHGATIRFIAQGQY
jgi:hypothetical protein